jgi:hypothetical protein
MARVEASDNQALTGLEYKSNGNSVTCAAGSFWHDDQGTYRYQVTLESQFLSGLDSRYLKYEYANDLDHTIAIKPGLEILAYAEAASQTCDIGRIPAIVRYPKQ